MARAYLGGMRVVPLSAVAVVALLATGCPTGGTGPDGLYFIPGSGALPTCADTPAGDLTGEWFDNGMLTIRADGCAGTMAGDVLTVCALNWQMTQTGNDVAIAVDNEYRIDGRICGDQLHLHGGWWLPTEDPPFGCTYEDDTAEEVGIEAAGNVLTLAENRLVGTLVVRGGCQAEYAIEMDRLYP